MRERRSTGKPIRVYVVDHQALWRACMALLVNRLQNCEVVGEAPNGELAVEMVRRDPPDLVFMEVSMPGIGGIEAVRRIRRFNSTVKIAMLTSVTTEPFPTRALQSGANGYLTKQASVCEFDMGVRMVMAGEKYICQGVVNSMASSGPSAGADSPFSTLSARELQIATLIIQGKKVADIAEQLYLSPKTINSYRYRIFSKLSVRNDVGIVLLATKSGLMQDMLSAF